jgi:hypothetical protein
MPRWYAGHGERSRRKAPEIRARQAHKHNRLKDLPTVPTRSSGPEMARRKMRYGRIGQKKSSVKHPDPSGETSPPDAPITPLFQVVAGRRSSTRRHIHSRSRPWYHCKKIVRSSKLGVTDVEFDCASHSGWRTGHAPVAFVSHGPTQAVFAPHHYPDAFPANPRPRHRHTNLCPAAGHDARGLSLHRGRTGRHARHRPWCHPA